MSSRTSVPPLDAGKLPTTPQVVSQPQQQKIIQDIRDCIKELKSDFEDSKIPIDDDNQTLHRFCAKLEYLLQSSMKERMSLLGRKKDYWDYFQECLRLTKGASDGIKYVKTLSEYKSSLGRGRALLRFCLMHSRMADTIQQCILNGKVTSEWYLPKSLWLQHDLSELIIEALYDLSDVQFDLVPRCYDLDNAWPSFAKKTGGAYNWNPPSRASSISSLASIPGLDGSIHKYNFSCTPTPSETSHLSEALHNDSTHTDLMDRINTLEHQKFSFQQSLAESRGELEALQNQHTALKTHHFELDETNMELEKKINKSDIEFKKSESEWRIKDSEYQCQFDILNQDSDKLKSQLSELETIIATSKKTEENGQKKISELDSSKSELLLQNKSLIHELEVTQQSDMNKSRCIDGLENKICILEAKNSEIMGKFETVLMDKSDTATYKLDTANSLHDVVGKLKETEEQNLQYQLNIVELKKQCSLLEKDMESVLNKLQNTDVRCKEELSNMEKSIGEQKEEMVENERQFMREREMFLTKLENCEQVIGKKENKILEMVSKIEQLQKKHYEKEKMDVKLLEDISKLTSDLETTKLRSQKCEMEMKEELEKVSCEKLDLTNQNSTFALEMNSLKLLQDSNNDIIESLSQECQKLSKQVEELSVNNSQWVHLNNRLKDTVEQQSLEHSSSEEVKMTLHDKMATIRNLELEQQRVKQAVKWLFDNRQQRDTVVIAADVQDKDTADVLNGLSNHLSTINSNLTEANDGSKQLCVELEKFRQEQFCLKNEINSYKDRISHLDSQISEINDCGNKLEECKSEIEKQLEMEKTHNRCLTEDLNTKDMKVKQLSEAFDGFKSENIKLSEELTVQSKEITSLNDCMQKSKVDVQMLVQSQQHSTTSHSLLTEQLQTKSKLIEDKEKLITTLEENDKTTRDKLDSLTEARNKVSMDKCAEIAELKKKLANIENEKKNMSEEKDCFLVKIKNLERDLAIVKLEKETDETRSKEALTSRQLERDEMYRHVEEALADTKSIKEQLQDTSVQLEAASGEKNQFEKECDSLHLETNKLERVVGEAKKNIENLENELKSLHSAVDSSEMKIADSDREKNELLNEMEDLKKTADDFSAIKSEEMADKVVMIERLEKHVSELTDNLKMIEEERKTEDESLLSLLVELQTITRERDQLKNEVLSLGTDVTEKVEAIGKLNRSSSHLQDTVGELEKCLAEKLDSMSQLESHKDDLTRDYSMQIESLQQEISALQFQFSTEQLQHEEALQIHVSKESSESELKEELMTQEAIIEQLESNLEQLKLEQDIERNEIQQRQLESQDLTMKVHEFARETEMWRSISEKQQLELEDEKNKGEDEIQKKTKELSLLQNDMSRMKKKLIKLIKEKDTLWQKTDSLAYQQKLQASEKWMEDNAVTHCLGCKEEFSFTLRKHHCRLCGRIFCYNCCNNWIMTAHSSKQCRVCNFCHQRHISQEDDIDSSFLGADSDDDDDDDDDEREKIMRRMRMKLPVEDMDSSTSSISAIDTEPTSTSGEADSDQVAEAPSSAIPGHVISNLTISLVGDNETDEIKRRKMKDGNERKEGEADESTEETDIFHLISDEEIAKSRSGSEEQQPTFSNPNMSCSLLLSADDLEKDQINHTNEVLVKAGKSHAIPIHIEKENTLLCWQFTSQPKDVMFGITYHASSEADVQTLIQSCKCESHKQTVKGEMTAKQPGIYTLIFDNTYSRLTSKKVIYSLWAKTGME